MKQKDYIQTTGLIFGIIAVLHAARVVFSWNAEIGGYSLPLWVSFVAVAVAGYFAWVSQKLKK